MVDHTSNNILWHDVWVNLEVVDQTVLIKTASSIVSSVFFRFDPTSTHHSDSPIREPRVSRLCSKRFGYVALQHVSLESISSEYGRVAVCTTANGSKLILEIRRTIRPSVSRRKRPALSPHVSLLPFPTLIHCS